MSLTSSVSEFVRAIAKAVNDNVCDCSPFDFGADLGAAVTVGPFEPTKMTGSGTFKVQLQLDCEVRVPNGEPDCDFVALEMTLATFELVKNNRFGCTATDPKNMVGAPYGSDNTHTYYRVSWDQEVMVERFIKQKN